MGEDTSRAEQAKQEVEQALRRMLANPRRTRL